RVVEPADRDERLDRIGSDFENRGLADTLLLLDHEDVVEIVDGSPWVSERKLEKRDLVPLPNTVPHLDLALQRTNRLDATEPCVEPHLHVARVVAHCVLPSLKRRLPRLCNELLRPIPVSALAFDLTPQPKDPRP